MDFSKESVLESLNKITKQNFEVVPGSIVYCKTRDRYETVKETYVYFGSDLKEVSYNHGKERYNIRNIVTTEKNEYYEVVMDIKKTFKENFVSIYRLKYENLFFGLLIFPNHFVFKKITPDLIREGEFF